MGTFREKTELPMNKKKIRDLYSEYMTLALDTLTTGDRALFEDYYQRAEYYLHLANKLSDDFPITPSSSRTPSTLKKRIAPNHTIDFHKECHNK